MFLCNEALYKEAKNLSMSHKKLSGKKYANTSRRIQDNKM